MSSQQSFQKPHPVLRRFETSTTERTSTSGGYPGSVTSLGSEYLTRSKKQISRIIVGGRIGSVAFFCIFIALVAFWSTYFSTRGGMHTAKSLGKHIVTSIGDYIVNDVTATLEQAAYALRSITQAVLSRRPDTFDDFLSLFNYLSALTNLALNGGNVVGAGFQLMPTPSSPTGSLLMTERDYYVAVMNSSTLYFYPYVNDAYGMSTVLWDTCIYADSNMLPVVHALWNATRDDLEAHPSLRNKAFFNAPMYLDSIRMMGLYPIYDPSGTTLKAFTVAEVDLGFVLNFLTENISHFLQANPKDFDLCILTADALIVQCACASADCDDSLQPLKPLTNSTTRMGGLFCQMLDHIGGLAAVFNNADGSRHDHFLHPNELPEYTTMLHQGHEHVAHLRVFAEEFNQPMILFLTFHTDPFFSQIRDAITTAVVVSLVAGLVGCALWSFFSYSVSVPLARQLHQDRRRQLRLVAEKQRLQLRLAAQDGAWEEEGLFDLSTDTPLSRIVQKLRSMHAIDPSPQLEEVINLLRHANSLQTVEWREQIRNMLRSSNATAGASASASGGSLLTFENREAGGDEPISTRTSRSTAKRRQIHDEETSLWLEQLFSEGGGGEPSHDSTLLVGSVSTRASFRIPIGSAGSLTRLPTQNSTLSMGEALLEIPGTPEPDREDDLLEYEDISDPLESWIVGGNEMIIRQALVQWNRSTFSVFQLDTLSNHHSLAVLTAYLTTLFGLHTAFPLKLSHMNAFLGKLEALYRANPYHNSLHAAEVLALTLKLVQEGGAADGFSNVDFLGLILAAIGHDVDHPGVNNAFLVTTTDPLAVRYNDSSVLENHHAATLFTLLSHSDYNFLVDLPPATQKELREAVISSILATDMTHHFSLMGEFTTYVEDSPLESGMALSREARLLYARIAVKLADIGHTMKSIPLTVEWTKRINDEFFAQGARERALGLPVSQFMDKTKMNIAKSQIGTPPRIFSSKSSVSLFVFILFYCSSLLTVVLFMGN